MSASNGHSVGVVGAGGNIGSHLVPHLARTPGIRRITLVDRDLYEPKNLASQDITRRDVGCPKADVQARRLQQIDETLDVVALTSAVEDVPLGCLRADVLLACVDSRSARRAINEIAWRLGVPWIDAGVLAEGLLARVNVYVPGREQLCIECPWDENDYAALEAAYPCADDPAPSPTNAPSALGALAAALEALECQKLLAGKWDDVAVGRQVTVSALGHRHHVTSFRPNEECRFDHEVWAIEPVDRPPDALTLEEAFRLGGGPQGANTEASLGVGGQMFVRKLTCPACGMTRDVHLHLFRRLTGSARRCDGCGKAMRAAGFDAVEWLWPEATPPALRGASLQSIGVAEGDVLSVRTAVRTTHHQIGGLR